jgi:small-conductance mechanosensitive channel
MKLRFTVPFDTDLEKVRKIFKKVGQQINENPEYAANLIEPFKSQGAGDVTDVGIVVRGKFTAKPGTQFPIRKEIYSRIQKAFKENGIEFARREVRVRMPDAPDGAPLSAETKAAIATAAIAGDAAARG